MIVKSSLTIGKPSFEALEGSHEKVENWEHYIYILCKARLAAAPHEGLKCESQGCDYAEF